MTFPGRFRPVSSQFLGMARTMLYRIGTRPAWADPQEGDPMKTVRASFGRMPEHVAKLTEDERTRAAIKPGQRIGDDDTLKVWNCRKALAKSIRIAERSAPVAPWRPLVPLADGEGY